MTPVLVFVVCLIAAFIGSVITSILILVKRTVGELIIDTTDPEKDIYRLELGKHLEDLGTKKHITLKVVHIQTSQN